MADRARSAYLRPPKGDPVDPQLYELREAAVRGAARCVAAGIRTYLPADPMGPAVLSVLNHEHGIEPCIHIADDDTWLLLLPEHAQP